MPTRTERPDSRAVRESRGPAWAGLLLSLSLAACATAAPPPVAVFQSLGSRQCEGGGRTADEWAEVLRGAGVPVLAVGCGTDGRMRPMVCGAADGRIAIIEIPAEHLAAADRLGFKPLTALPAARRLPCPAPAGR